MEFPLAERELTRSGRHWRTYALRVAATGAPCVALVFATPFSITEVGDPAAVGEAVSRVLLNLSLVFQYLVAFFIAPMYCAGSIAQEKQERTLGLLLMADFRGWDVYGAKFISAFLQCALLIASTLPLLAIAAILGGISVPAAIARFLLLITAIGTVCALGLLASTLAKKPSEALYISVFFIAAWFGFGWAISEVSNPTGNEAGWIVAFAGWGEDLFLESPSNWLSGVVLSFVIAIGAMAISLFLLPRQVYEKSGAPKRVRPRRVESFLVHRIFQLRPATALIRALLSGQRAGSGSGLLRLLLPVTMLLIGFIPAFSAGMVGFLLFAMTSLIVFAVLCYDLSTSIGHLRGNQAYDDLLVADLGVESIARSTWRALLVHSWPYYFGFLAGFAAMLLQTPLFSNGSGAQLSLLIAMGASVLFGGGAYAFAVAASCAVAVLRWGAVGQTIAGMFIFGWIQMFFFIGLIIMAMGISSLADQNANSTATTVAVLFGTGMALAIYTALTILFRRGFEHDFAYTLRNPDRMTLAPNQ